ncbi:MAG TPA: hypothetical protein VHC72_05930 [Bryobacteraceae bacterium]|nr:hypothetical protein [Bryobacteraceae bacterium]
MKKTIVGVLAVAAMAGAQSFQPPSWGQGQGHGSIEDQINQLQSQIQKLREQQHEMSRPPIEAQIGPVTAHPISGKETRRTTQTLGDGTELSHADTSYFYRDSSGRVREESPNRVEIFDNVGQAEYDMSPAKKTYSRSQLSGREHYIAVAVFGGTSYTSTSSDPDYAARHQPAGVTEDLEPQTLNGVYAKHSRVTITIPPGAIGNNREIKVVNERWYSDELKVLIKSVNTDPRFGVNTYELTDIKQTDPDPALFRPPADYTLVTREHR